MLRELWFRASLAWQQILEAKQGHRNILLVAHNAVNQALVATAIGLPPTYFRRLLQNNAATTVLDFQPNGDGPPRVNLDRLNQVGAPLMCSGQSYRTRTILMIMLGQEVSAVEGFSVWQLSRCVINAHALGM